jgi:hypothetical protein
MASFYVHGYEETVAEAGTCDRCSRKLSSAYLVSYDGIIAKYRLCAGCHSYLVASFGGAETPPGGPGKPRVE